MSAGRSRNIRVELVLQSISQLDDIYGKSNAMTILNNAAVKIAFRMSDWDTLVELSHLCGEKEKILMDGKFKQEPLITPTQLGAMQVGQALVMIAGRIKFVTWLPDYSEVFNDSLIKRTKSCIGSTERAKTDIFDIQDFVKKKIRQKMSSMLESPIEDKPGEELPISGLRPPNFERDGDDFDYDDLIKRIDAKIAELEAKEKEEERN